MHAQYKKKKIRACYEIAQIFLRDLALTIRKKKSFSSLLCINLFLSSCAVSPLYQPWWGSWNSHHCKHPCVPTVLYRANTRTVPKFMNFILTRKTLKWSHLHIAEQNRCCRFPEKSLESAFVFKILPVLFKMPCHQYQRWYAIDFSDW